MYFAQQESPMEIAERLGRRDILDGMAEVCSTWEAFEGNRHWPTIATRTHEVLDGNEFA